MSLVTRFRGWALALGSLAVGLAGLTAIAIDSGQQGMAHMAGHMYMTVLRPPKPGDQQKADAILAAAKTAMAPYQDYHKALADGYEIRAVNQWNKEGYSAGRVEVEGDYG